VPRPAAGAPPADLAPLADALEPPLEPEPPLELPLEPEPHPPTLAEDIAEDAFPEADDAASSTGSRETLPDPPSAAPGRATRGARPILGRLALCRNDPSLAPYEGALKARYDLHESRYDEIVRNEGSLKEFAESYKRYGIHKDVSPGAKPGDVTYVEYAPGAKRLSLMGDFNEWTPWEFEGEKDDFGNWTVKIPRDAGLRHGAAVRVAMETSDGEYFDRIPAWIQQIAPAVQETEANYHNGVYYDPPLEERHEWRHEKIVDDQNSASTHPSSLRIYEAHVGMSSEAHGYGTYREFADTHLRRIADLGYSAVQLMAVADHAYYASFGYQVTNFFAPAHRSGSPEDLKYLVDVAHGLKMKVLMDVVHAHASDNAIDGLNTFDGTNGHYFHEDPGLGWHKLWGTRMFNYG
jgi:1,4-alpha-glucan branching enzyme